MEQTSEPLPEDMMIQILIRMPLKSLVQCTCASKTLASLIRRKDFTDAYLVRSSERPRLLFTDSVSSKGLSFRSVYQEEKPLLSSGQKHVEFGVYRNPNMFSNPIRGLLSLQEKNNVKICNPFAKKLVTLPDVPRRETAVVKSFFGYDEVEDVFKVLCMTKTELKLTVEAKEHQVLTVGQNCWRSITCEHHHCPLTRGLCQRGFLYYGAWSNTEEKLVIMSFSMNSEKFTVIELPEGFYFRPHVNMVNYKGKLAIVDQNKFDKSVRESSDNVVALEMLVRNEIERNWSRIRIDIHGWKEMYGNSFIFKGTVGTGELVFASDYKTLRIMSVLYYDEGSKVLTKYKIEGVGEGNDHLFRTWLDHIDSPLHI